MVAIARALMPEPSALLLDEPSAGLAPMLVDGMFAQVSAINRGGIAILMVEQNARARSLCRTAAMCLTSAETVTKVAAATCWMIRESLSSISAPRSRSAAKDMRHESRCVRRPRGP